MTVLEQRMTLKLAAGGYSEDRYASWPAVARKLLAFGCTPHQAAAIMVSKWTRWAADASPAQYGKVPAKAIMDLVKHETAEEIRELTFRTFGRYQ